MRLRYATDRHPVRYPEDCQRIQRVLQSVGFVITLHEAERLWEAYSDDACASWLFLPKADEDIIIALTEDV